MNNIANPLKELAFFGNMNHPGVYFTILWLAALVGSVKLIQELKDNAGHASGYACPPCGCPLDDVIIAEPGVCNACRMPLITVERKWNNALEKVFRDRTVNFYHHKLFYPANFLALFVGFLALFRFRKETPTVLFLVFFLSIVLYCFAHQLYGTGYSMHASIRWALFPISFLLAASPALFLYITKSIQKSHIFLRRDWLHFLPGMVVFLANAILFSGPEGWREAAIYNGFDHFPGLAEQAVFLVSSPYYCIVTCKTLKNETPIQTSSNKWQWSLIAFLWATTIIMAIMILGNFLYFDLMSTILNYNSVWLIIAMFTLWCSYFLIFKKEVIYQNGIKKENRLSAAQLEQLKSKLESVMQAEKPYLNPELSLQTLAKTIGTKEKNLSEVLNMGFSKSFYDYINSYRIEDVKKMLLDTDKQHLTNFAIAQEAGFNSKSAFFGLFKKYVGMTPGEFKKRQGK